MTILPTSRFRPQVLVVFLVALGLLFAGLRTPDLSKPHRPKPTHRVVLENHHKSVSSHFKQCSDLVALLPQPPFFSSTASFSEESPAAPQLSPSPLLFPNSGRSPPATLG